MAGIGLGGVIPTAIAITVEFSKPHRRNFINALMFSGYAFGGIMTPLLAMALLQHIGFRGMLAIGSLPVVTVVPLIFFLLPESPAFLRVRRRIAEAEKVENDYGLAHASPAPVAAAAEPCREAKKGRLATMFSGVTALATLLFCLVGISGQTLVYGLNTWMPQLMILADYSLASSLSFLLTVNLEFS
nr:MFS transporter [Corynebacterium callunae]